MTLSKGRANSVVDYLVSRGIERERFQVVDGRGPSEPVADNGNAAGRAKNRRVEVTLLD
jgi:outer membrane protein OmpA-like peptidoglycan-associated protein